MKNNFWNIATIMLTILVFASCESQKKQKNEVIIETVNYLEESDIAFNERMEWWRDARFGMFIHWGVYAVPAGEYNGEPVEGIGEWIQQKGQIPKEDYEKFAKQFDPVKFDADAWVKSIVDAVMKYLVIT